MFFKQFGGRVTKVLKQQYAQSPNWKNGRFQNLEETALTTSFLDFPRIIYKQLATRKSQNPKDPINVIPIDHKNLSNDNGQAKIIWYGHSAIFMKIEGLNILIDPMLGPDTTPIAPFPTKRFSEDTLSIIDDLPAIDLMLITHDHYDHLDFASIQKLKTKTKKYFVSLGVKRHLVSWGVSSELITEFDWWDNKEIGNIDITFTPTRHFSGRGLTDRLKTLWGGWAFKSSNENIWFSGDGGYGAHFKEIGERLGPFDFAFMECGQYNDDWQEIHLFPDQAVYAAIDARAKKIMPVHWCGFALSYQHTWSEPPELFVKTAKEKNVNYSLPRLGEIFNTSSSIDKKWWLDLD